MTNGYRQEHPLIEPRWLMPVVDVALMVVAFMLAYIFRYDWQLIRPVIDPTRAEWMPYLPYAVFYALVLLVNYQANDLYKNLRGRAWGEEVSIIINGVTIATVLLLAAFFLFQPLITSRLMLVYVAGLTVVLLAMARLIRRAILARLRRRGIGVQRVLIVGMGAGGQAVIGTLISREDFGYDVVGYLDDDQQTAELTFRKVSYLGKLDELERVVHEQRIDVVMIALAWRHYDRIIQLGQTCQRLHIEVRVVPDIFQLNLRQVRVETLDGVPLLGLGGSHPLQGTQRLFKRALDMTITLVALPFWLPVIGIIALLIKLEDGGDVFFRQTRVGENGKPFTMFKFRSMIPNAEVLLEQLIKQYNLDPKHPKIPNDPRITRIGRFLRRTSIDELPNLFNVLRGEMSLVGPRPAVPEEVALYDAWHKQRLQCIPGMTGLWQVSGRSEIPFDEMVLMDIYYIENWSIIFDLQLLLMTVPRVVMRKGAY